MYYDKFINIVRKQEPQPYLTPNAQIPKDKYRFILSELEETRVFIFKRETAPKPEIKDNDDPLDSFVKMMEYVNGNQTKEIETDPELKEVDLPFVSCWFEVVDGYLTVERPDDQVKVRCCGMFVHEVRPREYQIYSLMKVRYGNDDWFYQVINGLADPAIKQINLTLVDMLLKRMGKEEASMVDIQHEVRYKLDNKKYKYKIKPVIYVYPKHDPITHTATGKVIEYSHRWEVRGHWRRLTNPESMGKNRHGQRTEKGYTWIIPFVKGNPSDPLVRKARKVKDTLDD